MDSDLEITIEKLAFGGAGVGHRQGKVAFVPGTVPGDRVKIRLVEEKERFDRAEVVELIESSPHRVEPRCSVFGVCGGCQWQQVAYVEQLHWKEQILKETLERLGQLKEIPLRPIIPSPDHWNYRRRIQLNKNGKGKIGFFKTASHEVVEFENCEISHSLLNQVLPELKKEASSLPERFELSVEEGEVVVEGLQGEDPLFSQVNPAVNERLVFTVLDFLFGRSEPSFNRKRQIVELYAGAGNFTLPLAKRAQKVFALEESVRALQKAEHQARMERISNIEFIHGSVEWGLNRLVRRGEKIDTLVLDPPRRGAKAILDLVAVMRPRFIVYVSCDPATLARDLKFLIGRHYGLTAVQPLDMFPQTYHVESVSHLIYGGERD